MQQSKGIVVLDIDGTILNANVQIGKTYPDGRKEWIPNEVYKNDPDLNNSDVSWDYSQFTDLNLLKQSILEAQPILSNLKIMDEKVMEGWDVCFLTARSYATEQVLYDALKEFLKVNDGMGNLYPIGDALKRDMCAAIGDCEQIESPYTGVNICARKGNVLKKLCALYDQVIFIDDDVNNITYANGLATELHNLQVIESLQESQIKPIRKLPALKGQISFVKIGIEENNIDCVVGFKDKKYWWYTSDKDITENIDEAITFNNVSSAQDFIDSIKIGELPKQGMLLHIIKLKDAVRLI